MKLAAVALSALCLSLCPPAARAGEFFVNVASGSDANAGTSAAAPWKTLTHALAVAGDFDDFIHVAPGDYSAATGEVFPLHLTGPDLFGDEGPAVTRIVGSGSGVLVEASGTTGKQTIQLDGLSLLNAATALRIELSQDLALVRLFDVAIVDMSGYAIDLQAHAESHRVSPPSFSTNFEDLDIADCGGGVRMSSTSATQASMLAMTNCSVRDSAGDGIHLDSLGGGQIFLGMNGTRVVRSGQAGVRVNASGFMQLGFGSCLIADNAVGIDVGNDGGNVQLGLFFTTVAGNAGSGLSLEDGLQSTSDFGGALFWGNGADLTGVGVMHAKNSDSEQDAFGSDTGNFSADPQFANAALGDYHLTFGSPCAETGDPTLTVSLFDLDKVLSPVDGDLDTQARMDVGCFELRPLVVQTTGALGSEALLQFFGSPCMQTTLFVAPGGPVIGHKTAFGKLLLGPGLFPLLVTIVLSPAPNVVVATIPNVPALVGATFSFQSLTQSVVAPKAAALTNVESFTVTQ